MLPKVRKHSPHFFTGEETVKGEITAFEQAPR